jgi:hypothetical protein
MPVGCILFLPGASRSEMLKKKQRINTNVIFQNISYFSSSGLHKYIIINFLCYEIQFDEDSMNKDKLSSSEEEI